MSDKSRNTHMKKWFYVRHGVQVLFVVLFVLPLLVAGWQLLGLYVGEEVQSAVPADFVFFGSLTASGIAGITLMDPLAFAQTVAASKTFDIAWLWYALPVLLVYAIIRGRVFCGWVCPVNLVLEIVDWLRKRLHIKVSKAPIPRHVKMWVALAVVVLSAVVSVPVFEALSPLNIVHKGILFGSTAGVFTLVAIIIAELFWGHRVWCRSLCPIGGVYEAVGRVGVLNVRFDADACVHCNACKKACLCDPVILDGCLEQGDAFVYAGDCMACGKCIDACPHKALSFGLKPPGMRGRPKGAKPSAGGAEGKTKKTINQTEDTERGESDERADG